MNVEYTFGGDSWDPLPLFDFGGNPNDNVEIKYPDEECKNDFGSSGTAEESPTKKIKILDKNEMYFKKTDYADVCFNVDGKCFFTTRHNLAIVSDFYKTMFQAISANDDGIYEIPVNDDPQQFEDFLNTFMPPQLLEIDERNCWYIMILSHKYDVKHIYEKCTNFIDDNILRPTVEQIESIEKINEKLFLKLCSRIMTSTDDIPYDKIKSENMRNVIAKLSLKLAKKNNIILKNLKNIFMHSGKTDKYSLARCLRIDKQYTEYVIKVLKLENKKK